MVKIIFPVWVWVMGLLAWFSAEIATFSTVWTAIKGDVIIFSMSFYIVQGAVFADIILRKRLSFRGIVIAGIIFGILEEVFYIKNGIIMAILLPLGHATVTILFPFLIANLLIPGKKEPFLSKIGYILALLYLAFLYIFMYFAMPFSDPVSLTIGIIALPILVVFIALKRYDGAVPGEGIGILEKIFVLAAAALTLLLTKQPYLAVMVLMVWLLIRQSAVSKANIVYFSILFIIFHFLASFMLQVDKYKIAINYPITVIVGSAIIALLILSKFLLFITGLFKGKNTNSFT